MGHCWPSGWLLQGFSRVLERSECFQGAALLLSVLSMHLLEMHRGMEDIRHQQADSTWEPEKRGQLS